MVAPHAAHFLKSALILGKNRGIRLAKGVILGESAEFVAEKVTRFLKNADFFAERR